MTPEHTYQVTIGEVARTLERLDAGQVTIIQRLDNQAAVFVTRHEWDMFQREYTAKRIPWTNVVSATVALAALALSILT